MDFKLVIFSIALLYINEWNFNLTWILTVVISTWIFKQGVSSKALKKRYYQWILEQKQDRNLPIVPKYNPFGQSAQEIGTIYNPNELKLEQFSKNGGSDSIFLHMADEHGNWLKLKLEIVENRLFAQIELIWGYQVHLL